MKKLITRDQEILGGKPIIAGTRMSVESVMELLSSGMEISEILKEYPFLSKEQVLACIEYATKLVGKRENYKEAAQTQVMPHEIRR